MLLEPGVGQADVELTETCLPSASWVLELRVCPQAGLHFIAWKALFWFVGVGSVVETNSSQPGAEVAHEVWALAVPLDDLSLVPSICIASTTVYDSSFRI